MYRYEAVKGKEGVLISFLSQEQIVTVEPLGTSLWANLPGITCISSNKFTIDVGDYLAIKFKNDDEVYFAMVTDIQFNIYEIETTHFKLDESNIFNIEAIGKRG